MNSKQVRILKKGETKTAEPIPTRVSKSSVPVINRLRILNKTQMHAVLATDSNGQPYTSLIAFALTPDLIRFFKSIKYH